MDDGGQNQEDKLDRDYVEWKGWTERFGTLEVVDERYFARELQGVWPKSAVPRILEIGFGSGQFLRFARDRGAEVTGSEINRILLKKAQEDGYKAVGADGLSVLDARSFDLIVAFDVLEHVSKADIPGFLSSLKNLLKPSGRIFFRYPNGDSWLGRINQNGDPTHVTEIGYLMLQYFCEGTGLAIDRYRAPHNRNLGAGGARAIHAFIMTPIAKLIGKLLRIIYFPGTPVVLSSSNVVAILRLDDHQ